MTGWFWIMEISLDFQEPLRIAAENLFLIRGIHLQRVDPVHARRILDEGIVDREHHPVDAELGDAALQRRVGEEAAGRDVEMIAKSIAEGFLRPLVAGPRQALVDAPEEEGQTLAHMAEDDLQ